MKIAGIILIVAGILMFVFGSVSFTKEKKVVDIGPVGINKKQKKRLTGLIMQAVSQLRQELLFYWWGVKKKRKEFSVEEWQASIIV